MAMSMPLAYLTTITEERGNQIDSHEVQRLISCEESQLSSH